MLTVTLLCFAVRSSDTLKLVPQFDDVLFKSHFRMSRQTFEVLLAQLSNYINVNDSRGNPGVEIRKQVMICIWTLANQESFRYILNTFSFTSFSTLMYTKLVNMLNFFNVKVYKQNAHSRCGICTVDLRVTWVCIHDLTCHQKDLKVD